jgi:hypothetical protein
LFPAASTRSRCGDCRQGAGVRLLADAEGAEDAGEDVVGGGGAGEGVEGAEGSVEVEQEDLVGQGGCVGVRCGVEGFEGVGEVLVLAEVVEQGSIGEGACGVEFAEDGGAEVVDAVAGEGAGEDGDGRLRWFGCGSLRCVRPATPFGQRPPDGDPGPRRLRSRGQRIGREQVEFVVDDEVGAVLEGGGEGLFGVGEGLGGVVDEEDEVGVGEGFVGSGDALGLGLVDGSGIPLMPQVRGHERGTREGFVGSGDALGLGLVDGSGIPLMPQVRGHERGTREGFVGSGDALGLGFVEGGGLPLMPQVRGHERGTRSGGGLVIAEAGGVDEAERDAVEGEGLFEGVAGGAGDGRDDGAVAFEEAVEEGAFAGVGRADEGDGCSVAEELAAAEGGGQGGEGGVGFEDAGGDGGGGDEVDVVELAGGKVHAGFEQGDEVEEGAFGGGELAGERSAELLGGDADLVEGLGGDEVVDGFGLGEVEAAGEEGTLCELAGGGQARAERQGSAEEGIEDDGRTVGGDFDEGVAGVAAGGVEDGDEGVVEGAGGVGGVEDAGAAGVGVEVWVVEWSVQVQEPGGDGEGVWAGEADDADAAAAGRGGDGGDGVGIGRMQHAIQDDTTQDDTTRSG